MMSSHVIGHGINEVVETAVTMFEKFEISVNACKKIINAGLDSSCRYDGNKYETIEYLYEDHCGQHVLQRPAFEPCGYHTWGIKHLFI